jgi:hypothetical protein
VVVFWCLSDKNTANNTFQFAQRKAVRVVQKLRSEKESEKRVAQSEVYWETALVHK